MGTRFLYLNCDEERKEQAKLPHLISVATSYRGTKHLRTLLHPSWIEEALAQLTSNSRHYHCATNS